MSVYYPQARVEINAIMENFTASTRSVTFDVQPLSISVVRNSYRQPDSFSLEFDAKDFPVTPAQVRTAQILIYLFDNKGTEPYKPTQQFKDAKERPAFVGIMDDMEVTFSESGRVVRMVGQDFTALFAEHQIKNRRNFTGKRLDKALEQLIREVDIGNVLSLDVRLPESFGGASKLPVIGPSASRVNQRGFPAKKGESYWDNMYNLALKHGFLLFVEDLKVVLTTPGFSQEIAAKNKRLFTLQWGRDVEELTLARNMGKERVPQVEVLCYDPKQRKTLSGRFPTKGQKVTSGVGTNHNEVLTSVVSGITKTSILNRLAEIQYTLIAQTEQTCELSTRELQDQFAMNFLEMRNGDALQLLFDPFNSDQIPQEKPVQWLVNRGFTRKTAQLILDNIDRLYIFQKPFYVREVTIDFDHENGISVRASVVNFVTTDGVQNAGTVKGAAESV